MKKFVQFLTAFAACAAILPVAAAVDITVNGVNVSAGSGPGWTASSTNLSLTGVGPFTISGNNNKEQFNINPLADCTIVATNLTVDNSSANGSALYIGGNPYHVTLLLAGTSTFAGGDNSAGICIESGEGSLTISNQEAAATLVVRGGDHGAGIGGGTYRAGGAVTITGGRIAATGGVLGAGIGGGNNSGKGGAVTISGGTVTATGGAGGAGIGCGYGGDGGTVTISGGTVSATGGDDGAGIGGGTFGAGGTVTISGGNVSATGTDGAGIGGGNSGTGGTVTISGGTVTATGGGEGAGIGGGKFGAGGKVTISGGTVSATGGRDGAGIGGGYDGAGGTVTIAGGMVTATGDRGAGIGGGGYSGGGDSGAGGTVTISGGTVLATRGHEWYQDIGGWVGATSGTNTFTGGSIILAHDSISRVPQNGTAPVNCVRFYGASSGTRFADLTNELARLSPAYGVKDIVNLNGRVCAWLPNGTYDFVIAGAHYPFTVADAATTVLVSPLVGVTVDGLDAAYGVGAGWAYDGTNLALTGTGPYVISGVNGTNAVSIRADVDCTVVASNLAVNVSAFNLPAFAVGTHGVTLVLAGANSLVGGGDGAGVSVTGGAGSLVVSNLDAAASLYAQGGSTLAGAGTTGGGAGIGGGLNEAGGTVTIAGGIVTAAGGERGQTDGMLVSITGSGAGIGGGFGGAGGAVDIVGGTVEANGGMGAPGIGYGTSGAKTGTNTFTGGSIVPVTIVPAPSNGVARAWCVTVPVGQAGPVNLTGPRGYGTNGIVADDKGNVYLWLPDGDYRFGVNGQPWWVSVAGAAVTAELGTFLGLTVNGTDLGCSSGAGWAYDGTNLALTGAGPYVISGTNGTNAVSIRADVDCTVVASNLAVDVSAFNLPAFAIGTNTATLVLAGTNRLRGGGDCAGIGVIGNGFAGGISIAGEKTGTLTIRSLDDSAASLYAMGGSTLAGTGTTGGGAGIGGGVNEAGGTVTILGGIVTAWGGSRGQAFGVITTIDGSGAGIGGGYGGAGGAVDIVGGTVSATGYNSAADIGPGHGASVIGMNTFRGGSIFLEKDSASPAPDNGSVSVYCVTVAGLAANARQVVVGLPAAYGVNGIYADAAGKIYLWLPDGTYTFGVNGQPERAVVAGTATSAVALTPVGVTVNGTDAAYGAGPGWTFAAPGLSLTNAGPFVIGGDNRGNPFTINPLADCVIVATNLTIDNSSTNGSALYIGTNSPAVTLLLAGTNTLAGGKGKAGVCIESGPGALVISNRDEAATLVARGGNDAAGIGGGSQGTGGKVTIAGGRIVATGAGGGAGIGGGTYCAGGAVTITGGRIAATGGVYGAGIGGGYAAAGGTVTISGGTVLAARGSQYYHDIGGFTGAAAGAVTLIGGSVHLLNGSVALAPSNNAERVWCVTTGGFVANAPVSLDLSGSYGTDGIYADASGKVYLWFPAGDYVEGGVSTDGATTNAVLQGFGVSAAGAVTGPTNVDLRITGVSTNGITGWTPDVLSPAHVETVYTTDLTNDVWSVDRPANAPTLFMKLRVR